jgi:hypothetical protein
MHKIAQTNPKIPIPSICDCGHLVSDFTLSLLLGRNEECFFESYWLQLDTAVVSSRLFDL